MTLDFKTRILFEKSARDAGFEISLSSDDQSMTFGSSLVRTKLRLAVSLDHFYLTTDDADITRELKRQTAGINGHLPVAGDAIRVTDMRMLHDLAERAFKLARAMPTRPLDEYRNRTGKLPPSTEVERIVKQRVGQDIFRAALDDYWDGKCAVTGISDRALLRASHIVPWAECASDGERLDVYNGILLVADLDAAFDAALLTFNSHGTPLLSERLSKVGRELLRARLAGSSIALTSRHLAYLNKHHVRFSSQANGSPLE